MKRCQLWNAVLRSSQRVKNVRSSNRSFVLTDKREMVNLFRVVHTIKSSGGTCDLLGDWCKNFDFKKSQIRYIFPCFSLRNSVLTNRKTKNRAYFPNILFDFFVTIYLFNRDTIMIECEQKKQKYSFRKCDVNCR